MSRVTIIVSWLYYRGDLNARFDRNLYVPNNDVTCSCVDHLYAVGISYCRCHN